MGSSVWGLKFVTSLVIVNRRRQSKVALKGML